MCHTHSFTCKSKGQFAKQHRPGQAPLSAIMTSASQHTSLPPSIPRKLAPQQLPLSSSCSSPPQPAPVPFVEVQHSYAERGGDRSRIIRYAIIRSITYPFLSHTHSSGLLRRCRPRMVSIPTYRPSLSLSFHPCNISFSHTTRRSTPYLSPAPSPGCPGTGLSTVDVWN